MKIRPIARKKLPILQDFLYLAIYQKEDKPPLLPEIIRQPELNTYVADFGRKDDVCLLADIDDTVVGVVWARISPGAGFKIKKASEIFRSFFY